jgi:quaternary ammonium compound-resistance protein SugE
MAWLYIILADVFEIAWPFALKWSLTYSKWTPALGAVIIALPVFFLIGECSFVLIILGTIGLRLFAD